ncbi:hypothetical protein [Sciscionella marina]|uniref:hypothetical protein n=1 Tax=Sciscionella marina TaxID=508770 RepID=UPI0003744327|nr:hypothetical protein [Sciscionella marina]
MWRKDANPIDAVLGLVTDPDLPTTIGTKLTEDITEWLRERTGRSWRVDLMSDPVAAGEADSARILDAVTEYREAQDWTYAICVTDLPLLLRDRPLLAETDSGRGTAMISLPAVGGLGARRGLRQVVLRLLGDLLDETAPALRSSVRRASLEEGHRYTVAPGPGWPRLIGGMVRANRPWRLIFGLSSALAAALATSAFGLSSSTIWQIGDLLDPVRRVLAAVASVVLLVSWLIAAHRLWERGKHRASGFRRLAVLYNASTVVTLFVGVGVLYLGLFAINLGIAAFLVPESLLSSTLGHPVGTGTYLSLAWGFTTMGVIAGAMGSSLESDAAVRQAAYGYREEQRRREYRSPES